MRLLGVDFGGKRIGLATVDSETRLPEPRGTLTAAGTLAKDAAAIQSFANQEGIKDVVIGLPLDENGETEMSRICRMLGGKMSDLGLTVHFVDESMTSQTVESTMRETGMKASEIRHRVDSAAACLILDRFLEGHGEA